jgi:glutamyl-tRNA reductase
LTVVVVGAGKMGATAAKRLRLEGCTQLVVANRSHTKARAIVEQLGAGSAVELPGLVEVMKGADIVVTSTGASHFVLTPGNVAEAMLARPGRPLFIIDIAVPRDADPEVARIPGVFLADIDHLKGIVDVTLDKRREAIPRVEEIIGEHAERFAHCPELSERERMLITGASLTIISKLLHGGVAKLRERVSNNDAEAMTLAALLDDLFDLRVQSEELAATRRLASAPVAAGEAGLAE